MLFILMLFVVAGSQPDSLLLWLLAAAIALVFVVPSYVLIRLHLSRGHWRLPPYQRAKSLLSLGEAAFFKVITATIGGGYLIFAKVRLADVIEVSKTPDSKAWWKAFNRISSKHLDFVICDPVSYAVIGVIELDDKSHRSLAAKKSDAFKDAALLQAGIPILRVPARASYSQAALAEAITEAFSVPPPIPTAY